MIISLPEHLNDNNYNLIKEIHFNNFNQIENLDMNDICQCKNLKKLYLRNYKINLPIEFGNLQNLKEITFNYCILSNIFEIISNIGNLEKLVIDCNITNLPRCITKLKKLKVLSIRFVDDIPIWIGRLKNLRILNLSLSSYPKILNTNYPSEIAKLQKLEMLGGSRIYYYEYEDCCLITKDNFDLCKQFIGNNIKYLNILDASNCKELDYLPDGIQVLKIGYLKYPLKNLPMTLDKLIIHHSSLKEEDFKLPYGCKIKIL